MEHITASFSKRSGPLHAAGPVHVVGAMNEVLQHHPPLHTDARAANFEHGRIMVYVAHSAAQSKIKQEEPTLLREVNQIIRRRYGGPEVTSIRTRVTPVP